MAADSTSQAKDASALSGLSPAEKKKLLAELLKKKAEANKVFPMSEGQQGLWHSFRRDPQATAFNVFLPTRIRQGLDVEALRRSMVLVAKRHPLLLATFSDSEGELTQRINDQRPPEFTVIELEGASDAEIQAELSRFSQESFDLRQGPLLRMLLFRVSPNDFVVLALTHHIVVDFWSLVIIMDEVRVAYSAIARGQSPKLAAASNNFVEFVSEQSKLLASPVGKRLKTHWQHILRQGSTVIELPLDFVRPAKFTGRAENFPLEFPVALSRKIKEVATAHQATAFTVLQSAVQVFLSRYCGEKSFFLGSPFSGRSHRRFENTVGFFVNMLPLHADLGDDPSFASLIGRNSNKLFDALEHEQYPISRMVQDSKIPRDASRSPAFQVSCTFEKSHLKEESGRASFLFPGETQVWNFGGLKQESFFVPVKTCHYDLEFIFEQTDSLLRGMLCYCRDLFTEDSVRCFAENFIGLLDSLLTQPAQSVARVPWSGQARSSALLRSSEPHDAMRVDAMLHRSVRSFPEQEAICFQGESLTYHEFWQRSEDLQASLPPVAREAIVPLVAGRGPRAWTAMLALNRAGAAFVPMDAAQPSVPLEEVRRQSEAPFVLVEDATSELGLKVSEVQPSNHSEQANTSDAAVENRADQLSYVVFTSGSTGKPKGVMLEHQAVCNTLQWRASDVPLRPGDRVLMLLSHQFDAGLGIAWTVLTQGATLVMADEETLRDPGAIVDLIIRENVNVVPAPPSLLGLITSHPRFQQCADRLKYVWTGGEAMSTDFPEQIRGLTRAKFFNFYGPTETAIESVFCEVSEHDGTCPVPIGRPIHNTEILILDEKRNIVPRTVPGEIAIGGSGLARGYLNDEELTRRRFIPHPASPTREGRVYLTGDRGRINAQGEVEFFGRNDHQIKLRGYRIELGEIETLLESHESIDRAAVVIDGEGTSAARMIAFASVRGKSTESKESLSAASGDVLRSQVRRFLAEKLPSYKMPSGLLLSDEMPLTSSGKVDRRRLPKIEKQQVELATIVPPTTELESFLCRQWQEILAVSEVGIQQNFFDLGGSSLQAALLTTSLSEKLGVDIPTSLLFDLADIQQIASRIVQLHGDVIQQRFGEACVAAHRGQLAMGASKPALHPLIAQFGTADEAAHGKPIFMIHPPGGIVVCYRALARQLKSRPIYGIRSHGLHGREEMPSTIEAMAAAYVEALRSVQATGPYVLGGWSLGGLVAYEVVQQLRRAGEETECLILLDTTIPEGASNLVPKAETVNVGLEYGIEMSLEQLGKLAPEEQLPFLWEHAKKLGVLDDDSPPEVVAKALEELQELFHHHVEVCRNYKMHPLDQTVILVRPQETPFELQVSEDRGWRSIVSNVNVFFAPGHHHSMVQSPNVEVLAEKLDHLLGPATGV
ncbi:MAG: amino acid adenylation domain-containing protein [Planctomycetota bacterium]